MRGKLKSVRVLPIAVCAIALAACSGETQQQKLVDAMTHGNSAQASQIWLHMDAKSKLAFEQGQGIKPTVSPDDVKKQIMQHYADKAGGENEDDTETVDNPAPAPGAHLGGLESLPEWVEPTGAAPEAPSLPKLDNPPPTATVPTK
jgi:hypothetical protein